MSEQSPIQIPSESAKSAEETIYEPLQNFPFPLRKQISPLIPTLEISKTQHSRDFFAFPTEPVPYKRQFLHDNIPSSETPKQILTVNGALWPAFYTELWGTSVEGIDSVDPNVKSFEYLRSFMESDDALKRKIQSYAPTLEPVYRLRDQMIGDAPYLRDIGLQRQDQGNYSDIIDLIKKNLFPSKPEGVKMRTQMRRQLNEMARQDKLTGTVGMLQHLPADQVAKADFIDLSNVPEYDLEFPIQPFLDMVNKGAYVYFAEINNKNPIETKASMLPIEQVSKSTVDTVLTPTSDVNQRTSFYLFKKK